MQAILHHRRESSLNSLGQRRGYYDPARFSLDLPWPRADPESAAPGPKGDYPSPPMSGSPPIPPKVTQEADERVHHPLYQAATSHDVYRASAATTQADSRMLPGLSAPLRPYQPEPLERMPYAFPRPEDHMQRPYSSYTSPHGQMLSQQHPYLPAPAPIPTSGSVPGYNPVTTRPPTQESQQSFASPKSQRKTKGHVASACVPCKKAHLRCDAQRPCTRCVQNGKEDACVDVQHKKRGRPRLRDDHRGTAFQDPRLGHGQDPNLRRPLSLYNPPGGISYGDDSLRRTQSYRVLKSQPPEPLAPRLLERGTVSGANVFPAPLHIPTRPAEPAAFLTMDLEIAKTSSTFLDAIGRAAVQGLRITDLLVPEDRGRMAALQRQIQDEQARREPNYLPPMYVKQEEEKVFRALGFSREDLAPYSLDMVDNLRFTDQTGQARSVHARLGLAKYGSIFFIVIAVSTGFRPFPTPSPQNRDPRELAYSYPPPQMPYAQPTPVSATFEHGRGRSASDAAYGLPRQPVTPSGVISGLSPRLSSSAYAASPSRPDYPPGPSAYIPRSELSSAPRPPQPAGYQLPPIRSQQQQQQQQQQQPQYQPQPQSQSQAPPQHAHYPPPPQARQHSVPSEQSWPRGDDRQRVDIGGLIDRPEPSHPHHQG